DLGQRVRARPRLGSQTARGPLGWVGQCRVAYPNGRDVTDATTGFHCGACEHGRMDFDPLRAIKLKPLSCRNARHERSASESEPPSPRASTARTRLYRGSKPHL